MADLTTPNTGRSARPARGAMACTDANISCTADSFSPGLDHPGATRGAAVYPPAAVVGRTAVPDITVDGYRVPAGTWWFSASTRYTVTPRCGSTCWPSTPIGSARRTAPAATAGNIRPLGADHDRASVPTSP
jgi:hypothetical protein